MSIMDMFKKESKESRFGSSGPSNEHETITKEKIQENFKKGLTDEDKKEPLVTDNYLEETAEETAEKVEDVRKEIKEMPGAEKKVA